MKIQIKTIAAVLCVAITFIFLDACKKHEDLIESPILPRGTNSVKGRITDINNEPISKAIVSDGQFTIATDINGEFILQNIQRSNARAIIRVSKDGYFPVSRILYCNGQSINSISIKLIPKIETGNFASSSGGTINIWGGGTVVIGAASVVNAASGSAYNGNVIVSTFYLDPSDNRCNEYMPGDLLGINTANEERILRSFGMLAIEMNNENGEKLQLAPGRSASITLSIPPDLQTKAADSIPLWYFDEHKNLWIEEGVAYKHGTTYMGNVSHFSFWNCDLPTKYVKLSATFQIPKGTLLDNYWVSVTSTVYGTRNGYTDNYGSVSGLIPQNETLILTMYDQCHQIIYTSNIGPYSADVDLGNITVANSPTQTYITLSGNVVTCNNLAVINGFVEVYNGINNFTAALVKGNFSITFPVCTSANNSITLVAIDRSNSLQSELQIINRNNGSQNIGQITACTDLR